MPKHEPEVLAAKKKLKRKARATPNRETRLPASNRVQVMIYHPPAVSQKITYRITYTKYCSICGDRFDTANDDAATCSRRCQKVMQRRRKGE